MTIAPTAEELSAHAVASIIERAKALAKDPEFNKWKVYECAKAMIADCAVTSDEYQQAIKLLVEALNI